MRWLVLTIYEIGMHNRIRIVPIKYCLVIFRLHYYADASRMSRYYSA